MRLLRQLGAAAALSLAAAGMAQTAVPMTPAQAVAAAATTPAGVSGTFDVIVGSTGASGYDAYLNSAKNYHDPANLTVVLHAGARAKLQAKLGAEAQDVLTGKHVQVKGTAKRVSFPRRDGTSNFQTRVEVDTIDQITVLN